MRPAVGLLLFYKEKNEENALKLDLPLIPHYLSMTVLGSSDRIMINSLCGKSYTALYSVPYNASMIMQIVTSSINSSFIPWTYQKCVKKGNDSCHPRNKRTRPRYDPADGQ